MDSPPSVNGPVFALLGIASVELAGGVLLAPQAGALVALDPGQGAAALGVRIAVAVAATFAIGLALALVSAAAAVGLWLRRPWGWLLAVLAAGLALPSVCAPAAAFTLVVLARPDQRRLWHETGQGLDKG